eukprot:3715912-Prymnesium_polylepis.1
MTSRLSFYFVPRFVILSCKTKSLPRMQDLRDGGHLRKQEIYLFEAFRGEGLINDILFVSHRWENPIAPDSEGVQLKALQEHLQAHPHLQLVWYDFSALPHTP